MNHERGSDMKWTVNPQAIVQKLGEAIVIVNLDSDRILELNETGARLFELVASGLTQQDVVATLAAEYDIGTEQAEREVSAALELLLQEQVMEAHAA